MSCLYGQHILMELIVEFADTIIAKKITVIRKTHMQQFWDWNRSLKVDSERA